MKCLNCGAEVGGRFCRRCGASVEQEQEQKPDHPTQPEIIEEMNQTEPEVGHPQIEQPVNEDLIQETEEEAIRQEPEGNTTVKQSLYRNAISALVVSAAVTGIMSALALFIDFLSKRGSFFYDVMYHLMKNVVGIPAEQAAYFSGEVNPGFWIHMLLLHGGTIEGTYTAMLDGGAAQAMPFRVHIPLLVEIAIGFGLLWLLIRLLRPFLRRVVSNDWGRLLWAACFGAAYAAGVVMILFIASPNQSFIFGNDQYMLELGVSAWGTLGLVFTIGLLAAAAGLGEWRFLSYPGWKEWVASLRTFLLTVIGFFILIAGLMVTNWSVSSQSSLYSTEIMTMGSLWEAYKSEPSVYAVLPNVLLQEQIYSLGGTWHVSGQPSADLLGMKQAIKLSIWSGIEPVMMIDDAMQTDVVKASLSSLESDIRLRWYHIAFALVFLFALSRIRLKHIWIYSVTVIGIVGVTAILSVYSNIKIATGLSPMTFIGFRWEQATLAIGVCVTVYLAASYGVQRAMAVRRRG